MSRQAGLDCSGDFKAAPDIRQSGPAAGGGYVLRTGPKVKVEGTAGLLSARGLPWRASQSDIAGAAPAGGQKARPAPSLSGLNSRRLQQCPNDSTVAVRKRRGPSETECQFGMTGLNWDSNFKRTA